MFGFFVKGGEMKEWLKTQQELTDLKTIDQVEKVHQLNESVKTFVTE